MRTDAPIITWSSLLAIEAPRTSLLVATNEQLAQFLDERPNGELVIRLVDGERCATKETLLDEWASVLKFPDYFGRNWDAFIDCMTDLTWLPGSQYIVIVTSLDKILNREKKQFRTFIEVLGDIASDGVRIGWPKGVAEREGRIGFVLQTHDSGERVSVQKLRAAGFQFPSWRLR